MLSMRFWPITASPIRAMSALKHTIQHVEYKVLAHHSQSNQGDVSSETHDITWGKTRAFNSTVRLSGWTYLCISSSLIRLKVSLWMGHVFMSWDIMKASLAKAQLLLFLLSYIDWEKHQTLWENLRKLGGKRGKWFRNHFLCKYNHWIKRNSRD